MQTITEDLTYLKPSAWIYWQAVEPYSAWGLVNAAYGNAQDIVYDLSSLGSVPTANTVYSTVVSGVVL